MEMARARATIREKLALLAGRQDRVDSGHRSAVLVDLLAYDSRVLGGAYVGALSTDARAGFIGCASCGIARLGRAGDGPEPGCGGAGHGFLTAHQRVTSSEIASVGIRRAGCRRPRVGWVVGVLVRAGAPSV